MLAMVFLHHLHEVRTVFGGHQAADVLMMTVFFVFAACGLDAEGTAVAVEVEFDLFDALCLLVVDVVGGLPSFDGFGNGDGLLADGGKVQN